MIRSIALALAGVGALALTSAAVAQSPAATQSASVAPPSSPPSSEGATSEKFSGSHAELKAADPTSGLPGLPPVPSAKDSTIFGGAIRKIDPVRDQFMLDIYGQRPMKVLFDERTQVYRDGVKIPLHDLGPADHASVQTALDGARIFAISVHILATIPQGQYRGRVLRFDESTGELRLDASPSSQPFTVLVPGNLAIVRRGQSGFTQEGGGGRGDLRPGALVNVTFGSGTGPLGVASQIEVLAVPGASFIFSGDITALDVSSGSLTLVDPRDQKSYQISFIPSAFPLARTLHLGQRVRITASFDGSSYLASDIIASNSTTSY
jgi:hypothetical protein